MNRVESKLNHLLRKLPAGVKIFQNQDLEYLTFPKMALFGLIRDNVRYFDMCFLRQEWKFMHFQTIISLFHHVIPQSGLDFALEKGKIHLEPGRSDIFCYERSLTFNLRVQCCIIKDQRSHDRSDDTILEITWSMLSDWNSRII